MDVLLREKHEAESAKAFLKQVIKRRGVVLDEVITDKHRAYVQPVKQHTLYAKHRRTGLHCKRALTTKPIEHSSIPVRDRRRPMRGLNSVETGQRLLEGVDLAQALQRGDVYRSGRGDLGSIHERVRAGVMTFAWLRDYEPLLERRRGCNFMCWRSSVRHTPAQLYNLPILSSEYVKL